MTVGVDQVYWDPFTRDLNIDPHSVFRRMREESPLYYNEKHDFYAVSRYQDVKDLRDPRIFINGKGCAPIERMPNTGMEPMALMEMDPPIHTSYRRIGAKHYRPKAIAELAEKLVL